MEMFQKKIIDSISIYYLDGEIDFLKAPEFKSQLMEDIEENQPEKIIINLKDVSYLDSSGIGALVGVISKHRDKIKMRLCNLQKSILNVLKLTGLLSLFTIDANEAESLEKIKKS